MGMTEKDWFLLLAGFILSIVATAVWQYWSALSDRRRKTTQSFDEIWNERINSNGLVVRSDAETEIIIRSFYWFVIGNMMFAVSGLAWVLDLTAISGAQSILASSTSFIAVFFFAASLKWLRVYLRLKRPMSGKAAT